MDLLTRIRARRAARPDVAARRWYDIHNAAGDTAVIRLYDEISWWGISADQFTSELAAITAPAIRVEINSPGGDVFDGIAIYNALRAHPAHVTTRVDGLAASIASIIAQAGDHRVMLEAAQMMIHDPWGVCVGSASEMRAFAEILDAQAGVLAGIYARRSGRSVDDMRALMAAETWLTDAATVDAGLADEILVLAPAAAPAARIPIDISAEAIAAAVREQLAATQIDAGTPAGDEPPAPAGDPTGPDPEPGVPISAAQALLAAFSPEEQS